MQIQNSRSQSVKASYNSPKLTALGTVQNFVLGALINGADADTEADNNETS